MAIRPALFLVSMPLALALAACGDKAKDDAAADGTDPALTGALSDQIMVDPDLAAQNGGNAAIGGGGPASGEIPAEKRTPEAIAQAKAEAAKLAGGAMQTAPAAVTANAAVDPTTPTSLADVLPGNGADCASKVDHTLAWAAKMPAAFPVYPRAHAQEAAGTDKDGCRLRVVNFITPVGVDDVVNFYYTRARAGGYDAEHRQEGGDRVLGGSKGAAAYVIYTRKLPDGLTEVDLLTNGG